MWPLHWLQHGIEKEAARKPASSQPVVRQILKFKNFDAERFGERRERMVGGCSLKFWSIIFKSD